MSDLPPPLLLRDVEVRGRRVDVRVRAGVVTAVSAGLAPAGDERVLDGHGGALLPGLHDHHVHLAATAASFASVCLGPPVVTSPAAFDRALARAHAAAAAGEWVRAVGQDDATSGPLDRYRLDALAPGRPVRVQHASGHRWVLSTVAMQRLGLRAGVAGVEESDGLATGRVYGLDAVIRRVLPPVVPDLALLGRTLLRLGVTSVSDLTATSSVEDLALIADAVAAGDLPQRVRVSGGPSVATWRATGVATGPVKVVLADHDLPALDDVRAAVGAARVAGRPVAFHCVSRASLALALAALQQAGPAAGDRIEHAAVAPPELIALMARAKLAVVTQPSFIGLRGDQYLDEVDPDDLPHLYPVRSLLDAGVPVAASSDAPFGDLDPWRGIRDAVTRAAGSGRTVGARHRVDAGTALAMYLGAPEAPGGRVRRVTPGAPADLCLLGEPARAALRQPSAELVRATVIGGRVHPVRSA